MRPIATAIALTALTATAVITPAAAQLIIEPQVVVDPIVVARGPVTADQARAIAFGNGIVMIEEFDFDADDARWEIEGRDEWNRDREIDIDARTGRILRLE